MAEYTEVAPKQQEPKNMLSLLPKFDLKKIPFFNQNPKKPEEGTAVSEESGKTSTVSETDNATTVQPTLARFPDAARPVIPAPIEFDAEEPAGRTSNPVVLWQVYALGGFLVLRWVWARWQERKERSGKKESDNNNESSPADENEGYHSA